MVKKMNWTKNVKFSTRSPCVGNDKELNLLTHEADVLMTIMNSFDKLISETFCLEHCGLDSAHHFTLLSSAWDALLLKIDPLTEQQMREMNEEGVRGGMCLSHREGATRTNLASKEKQTRTLGSLEP